MSQCRAAIVESAIVGRRNLEKESAGQVILAGWHRCMSNRLAGKDLCACRTPSGYEHPALAGAASFGKGCLCSDLS
jgi:hypothetical protein